MSTKFNPHQWINNTPAVQSSPAAPATSYSSNDPYDDIEIITTRIESARIDITSGYTAWRDLGFALSDALGENGEHIISASAVFIRNTLQKKQTNNMINVCVHTAQESQ